MVIWFGRLNGWYSQVYSCVRSPGGTESMTSRGRQQEEGNKRGSPNNSAGKGWNSGVNHIRPLEEIIFHWMKECKRKGGRKEHRRADKSWVLMQNRLVTFLLDLWPPLSLWQEVKPSADRKHSSNLHTCGTRSYLYPIIMSRFIGAWLFLGERETLRNSVPF